MARIVESFQTPELLSAKSVGRMLDVSSRTVWKKAKAGLLPAPLYIGHGTPRWVRADVLNKLKFSRGLGPRRMPTNTKKNPVTGVDAMQQMTGTQ